MFAFLSWYLLISLIGWVTFPLVYRLLPALPDRGYAFSRTLGLLLWGYLFWVLASLGILRNDLGGILFALLLVIMLSLWALWLGSTAHSGRFEAGAREILAWMRAQRALILGIEALFLAAFAGWTLVRAANPEIFGTEKPMEVGFINAILNSPTMPPRDPWLSGYAISYYYFGYVLIAMLAQLTAVAGSVAFNLGLGLVFGLSALGAYGLVYNLLAARGARQAHPPEREAAESGYPYAANAARGALLGPLFILVVSNIEGFLEVLHARGILPASFWAWLDIVDINVPPAEPFTWLPRLYATGGWWWWRASRVLLDYDFAGNPKEIIDEFPFFSFLLGDLHPHVLAIPFAFLAMALALNLILSSRRHSLTWFQRKVNTRLLAWGAVVLMLAGILSLRNGVNNLNVRQVGLGLIALFAGGFAFVSIPPPSRQRGLSLFTTRDSEAVLLGVKLEIGSFDLLLCWVVFGGLGFLNTWDFPFYVALFAGAYVMRAMRAGAGISLGRGILEFLKMGLILGIGGVLVYLPFYLGFASQAGGILPNLIYPTRGAHLWVMFATLLVPLFLYLFWLAKRRRAGVPLRRVLVLVLAGLLSLWLISLLLGVGIAVLPGLGDLFLASLAANTLRDVLQMAVIRRLVNLGGWLTLTVLWTLILASLWRPRPASVRQIPDLNRVDAFTLLLIMLGALLVLGPEFFFLRDQFGWRINTIFKFYYQTWLLWGIAAAYAVSVLWKSLERLNGLFLRIGLVGLLGMGLVYPLLGVWDKTHGFAPPDGWSLDGAAHFQRGAPDDLAAIRWLRNAPDGVLVEAVGGSYSGFARVSAFSGQPTVLGWPGHESQWRGGGEEMGTRETDIQRLYCTRDWKEAEMIIRQYQVRYIYVGPLERTAYTVETCGSGLQEEKFRRNLQPVFQQGSVTIYEAPP